MDLLLVHRFEIAVVCRPQDGVYDILSDNLGDPFCDPSIDADCFELEDIMSVSFVMGIVAVCDFWIDGAVIGADDIDSRS